MSAYCERCGRTFPEWATVACSRCNPPRKTIGQRLSDLDDWLSYRANVLQFVGTWTVIWIIIAFAAVTILVPLAYILWLWGMTLVEWIG